MSSNGGVTAGWRICLDGATGGRRLKAKKTSGMVRSLAQQRKENYFMKHRLMILTWCAAALLFGFANFARAGAGYALQFQNSGNQFVFFPVTSSSILYPFTVTAWIKAGEQPSDGFEATQIIYRPQLNFDGWSLNIFNGDIRATYFANGNYVSDGGPPQNGGLNGGPVGDNQWHHVAFTVDASGGNIYVDGVLSTNKAWVGIPGGQNSAAPLYFGHGPAPAQYVGLLDEVTLWNQALTQAQIQTNMNRGLTGLETNLIGYYRCDESIGPITYDSAPAGGTNNGSWQGVAAVPSDAPLHSPPTVQTLPATSVGANSATLQGMANPNGTNTFVWFEWGTTTNYGNVTAPMFIGFFTNDLPFGQSITGLNLGTTYHFRAAGSNVFGVARGGNQSFTTPNSFENINGGFTAAYGGVAWGDSDNDGWLDLGFGGTMRNASNNFVTITEMWRNNGNGFSISHSNFVSGDNYNYTHATWGEQNNDGLLDVILGGPAVRLFRSTGSGFTNFLAGSSGYSGGPLADWGDFNNDGLQDILLPSSTFVFALLKNNGSNFVNGATLPTGSSIGNLASWGDYDKDGWLDVFVGINNSGSTSTGARMWRNYGGLAFSNQFTLGPCFFGSAAWGDYDNDGWMDLLVAGSTTNNAITTFTRVWRNTGGTGFTNINAGLPGVALGSVAWGDYDNDGRLDIALTGTNELLGPITQIWRNTGSGFTNINAGLPGLYYSSIAWGDYNKESRLDLALSGVVVPSTQFVCQVWRNLGFATNTPPSAPSGLSILLTNSTVILSWDASSDAQTPANGLTYNVRIGSSPGASDILSPMAFSNGTRKLVRAGNAGTRRFAVFNYTLDKPYYWSVQAVDSAFAGSPFAAEQNFRVLHPSPTLVAAPVTALIPGDIDNNGFVEPSELNTVLSNYFVNSPWLQMTNVIGLGGTEVAFSLTNDLSGAFTVEYTTNLADWQTLGPALPFYYFSDTNAPVDSDRYYRLRWP